MKVIISTIHEKMGLYKVYRSLNEVQDWGKVDSLVFHSCTDASIDTVFILNNIPDNVKQRVYVNTILDPLIYRTFMSLNGCIYTDEAFLDDAESVDYLLANAGNIGSEINDTADSVEKLSECINTVVEADAETRLSLLSNKNWVQTLNSIMMRTTYSTQIALRGTEQMRDFLKTVDTYIGDLKIQQNKSIADIEQLKKNLEVITQKNSSLKAFGTYKPTDLTKPILYIRCIGDIQFLVTFLLCFQQYCAVTKHRKSKLLLIRPQQYNYITRYSSGDFYRLDSSTVKYYDVQNNPKDLFVTYEPVKSVMETFFKLPCDFTIVVDYLQNNKSLIENTANVISCLAYGSMGYYENNTINPKKLPAERLFFTHRGVEGSNVIPYMSEFTSNMTEQQKTKLYFTHTKDMMVHLAGLLNL